MPSTTVKIIECHNCRAKNKVTITAGEYPQRSEEIGNCQNCGTELIKKNITGDIEVELIEE